MVKVFGHLSPDTDTTGSAILWAWYLNTSSTHEATPFVLGTLNKETTFVLERWGIPEPALLESITEVDRVVIVDTNNPQELPENIFEANIIQIIDHHKLSGGISTDSPVDITMRTCACTATILHGLMGHYAEKMPKNMMGLLLSCILSDTLAFRSPTTTPHDKDVAEHLASKLGINIQKYADEMFKAKSDVSDFTDIGLIHLDSKKYEVGNKNLRISTLETTDPQSVLDRKNGLISAIKTVVSEDKDIDDVLFFIIDILKEEAIAFTYNQFTKDVISTSFGVEVNEDTEVLPGILSRKKQIIPMLKLPTV